LALAALVDQRQQRRHITMELKDQIPYFLQSHLLAADMGRLEFPARLEIMAEAEVPAAAAD